MNVFYLILLILAAACFAAVALRVNATKVGLLGLGLCFWVLVPLIQAARNLN